MPWTEYIKGRYYGWRQNEGPQLELVDLDTKGVLHYDGTRAETILARLGQTRTPEEIDIICWSYFITDTDKVVV